MYCDSIDKLVFSYFTALTKDEIIYKGKTIKPYPLTISPLIFRSFECLEMCAGCCPVFSLDYLEDRVDLVKRKIAFNNKEITIYSDLQTGNKGKHCKHVDNKGRCIIHGHQPLSCDLELMKATINKCHKKNYISTKKFSRGWNMLRVDGKRGALCVIKDITPKSIMEIRRKINLLEFWCSHFGLNSWCSEIVNWIDEGNIKKPLILDNNKPILHQYRIIK